jgi:transcriptional regulator with XRE-family HTH domain
MLLMSSGRTSNVGELLRSWRKRRGLSQQALSLDSAISTRHLSFVETGRAKPSREMVVHLAEQLEVPLRDRNGLLLAAGFAPLHGERTLEDEEMGPVRQGARPVPASTRAIPGARGRRALEHRRAKQRAQRAH